VTLAQLISQFRLDGEDAALADDERQIEAVISGEPVDLIVKMPLVFGVDRGDRRFAGQAARASGGGVVVVEHDDRVLRRFCDLKIGGEWRQQRACPVGRAELVKVVADSCCGGERSLQHRDSAVQKADRR
jgi:hypothetical protein